MKMIWAGFGIVNHAGIQKMNKSEMQLRELELIDMIVMRGIRDNKVKFEDYPELNNELKEIQEKLYGKEDKMPCDFLSAHEPWDINDIVENELVTAEDFNKRLKDSIFLDEEER